MDVTTLIPAYKPKYLIDLLMALRQQTVRPRRILISDDSPDGAFKVALNGGALAQWVAGMNVEVIDGPRTGATANFRHLVKVWDGATPLVHLLCDDDIIYPDFYERHIAVHRTGSIDCSVSRRWTALDSGLPVGVLPVPANIVQHSSRAVAIDSNTAFQTTIPDCNNWFGEFSHAVFNAQVAGEFEHWSMSGISYEGLADVGMILMASMQRPLCWINDTLGFFRTSDEQNTQQMQGQVMMAAHLAWIALALGAKRLGRISAEQMVQCVARISVVIEQRYAQTEAMMEFIELFPSLLQQAPASEERFVKAWHRFIGAN